MSNNKEKSDRRGEARDSEPLKEDNEGKITEYVFLDINSSSTEEAEKASFDPGQNPGEIFESVQSLSQGNYPSYLRMLAFLATLVMALGSILALIMTLGIGTISLILLRQSVGVNKQASFAWRCFKKMLVFTLGCFVGIFHLSYGIGLILMYFLLTGESVNNRWMQEFTRYRGP
ncbi:hypothetical protein DB42_BL00390 [Neochlamydia sp. EPS4]|uniref:hypothetical protein n=1 Tax=Neochlamydia sp. EPS4 TaxID=1478175 RepID=UPI0005824580|nr:hypothetical protein [Neochlamydia sp. EPS4]KIC74114.1 hypothetical protein DB42_BL00390 [Neochlamydia sp. EPS4]